MANVIRRCSTTAMVIVLRAYPQTRIEAHIFIWELTTSLMYEFLSVKQTLHQHLLEGLNIMDNGNINLSN